MANTRSVSSVWLIGGLEEGFKTSKLPSRGEVLKVLFYYHVAESMGLKESLDKTVSLLLPVWQMARVPTKAPNHIIEHVRKLHGEWQGLKKRINRTSDTNVSNHTMFQDSLGDLFDVAHRDAMTLMKVEDRLFLEAQREKGRRGTMAGLDRSLALKEERVMKRKVAAANYALKMKSAVTTEGTSSSADVHGENDDDEAGDYDDPDEDCDFSAGNITLGEPTPASECPSTSKCRLRGTREMVTPEVTAALDRTNTSDRKAAHILSAIASTGQLQHESQELIVSRSSIRRARMKHREALASEVKVSFHPSVPLVLHWDGKIMEDYSGPGRDHVDRLPVLVSGQDVVKLLAVPKLHDGTAVTMSRAVTDVIDEWGLRSSIKGLCFDTTASNTGAKGGACLLLEKEIGQEVLHLACRHHIAEIMLEKVFTLYDVSKSPNMELFGHFRDFWPRIDQTSFSTAMDDENLAASVASWKDDVIKFSVALLETFQPRDDYFELLELTIIFLGGTPTHGIHFRFPGAIHRARWMARAIYCIKMWLFKSQYEPLQSTSTGTRKTRGPSHSSLIWTHLQEVCLFITSVYVKYWFQTPSAITAPRHDLELLCKLSTYPNKNIAKAATTAFSRHLWYLSELLVGFCLL